MASGIVVWEWQNDFGCWHPYDPRVSSFIESQKACTVPLKLGNVDPSFYRYEIDLQTMCQVRQGTGTQRLVRRSVYPVSSPLGKGITWQWEGDALGQWNDFDVNVIDCLEDSYSKGQSYIDLSISKVRLPYHIDLIKMTQTRINTGRVRQIQRVFTSASYPMDLSLSTTASAGNGSKRNLSSGPRNMTVKKARTVVSSSTSYTGSIVSPFGNPGYTCPTTSTNNSNYGFPNPLVYSSAPSSSTFTSNPSSVLQFGQTQGPLTRRRYNQTISNMGLHSVGPSGHSGQPLSLTSNTNVPGAGSNFNVQSAANPFMYGLFSGNQMPGSSPVVFGGLPSGSSQFGFAPNPTSNSQQPQNYSVNLNPSTVFGGTRNGRIRPRGSCGFPQSQGRIPNYEPASEQSQKQEHKFDDFIYKYAVIMASSPADEDCCICCEKLQEASGHSSGMPEDHAVIQLEKCSHMYHKLCLQAMYNSGTKEGGIQCPTCKTIYGVKRGNCPPGEMEFNFINSRLPGHERHKTIQVSYHISSGTQGPDHPHPGKRYHTRGFPRVGYIPDCDKGRKILQLLIIAWQRRLTFTIGTSATTGEDDMVVWNEIHHKTELGSNYSGHGFPDPKYLDNLLLELAVHGITERDIPT